MSRQSELAQLGRVFDTGPLSNRNLIINGAMQVAQRGTSSSPAPSGYLIDRFATYKSGSGVFDVEQSTDAPSGFTNSLKISVTTSSTPSATDYYIVNHPIEGYNFAQLGQGTSDAKTFTLSFYVKCSVAGTFSGTFRDSISSLSYAFEYTVSAVNTWERKSITIEGTSGGTFNSTNTMGSPLCFSLGQGSNFSTSTVGSWIGGNFHGSTTETDLISNASATWQITGVQLEVGDTATPFEHRSYGDELDRCKRYFQVVAPTGGSKWVTYGHGWSSTQIEGILRYEKEMRATPSFTMPLGTGYYRFESVSGSLSVNYIFSYIPTNQSMLVYAGSGQGLSGVSTTAGYRIKTWDASSYIWLNAEL